MSERSQQLYRERIAYFVFMRYWFTILTVTDLKILERGGAPQEGLREEILPKFKPLWVLKLTFLVKKGGCPLYQPLIYSVLFLYI